MRQRAICAKRLAKGKAIALPWVRARGRALRNCLRTAQGQARSRSIGEEPSGRGGPRARPLLLHWRGALGPSPKAQPMACNCSVCKPFCRARPRARTTGSPLARPRPVQGHKGLLRWQKAPAKGPPSGPKFFSTFFHKPPCALSADVVNLRQFKGQNRFTMGL